MQVVRGQMMAFGVVSGIASAILGTFFLESLLVAPGLLFAACVVIPWARMCGWPLWRVACMAVLCVIGYSVAHAIAAVTEYVAAPIGAGVGTAIMLIPAYMDNLPAVRRAASRALIVGVFAAFVFTGFAFVPQGWWGLLLGIIVWQVAVAAALAPAVEPVSIAMSAVGGSNEHISSSCEA